MIDDNVVWLMVDVVMEDLSELRKIQTTELILMN